MTKAQKQKETQAAISLFALSLGQVLGSLAREDIKQYLMKTEIIEEDNIYEILEMLKILASRFYDTEENEDEEENKSPFTNFFDKPAFGDGEE